MLSICISSLLFCLQADVYLQYAGTEHFISFYFSKITTSKIHSISRTKARGFNKTDKSLITKSHKMI